MDTSRYTIKHFHLEYLSAAVSLLPYTLETSLITTSLLLLAATVLKHHVEGFRVNFLVLAMAQLSYMLGLSVLHVLLVAVYILSVYKFRVYEVPLSKNNIGYRRVNLGHASFEMFYVTEQTAGEELSLFEKGVWNIMFEIVNKDTEHPSKLPRWVMYLVTHYYTKMTMRDICPSAKPRPGTYQTLVLSHQLGLNSLYTYAREFADDGFLVISLIHKEEIRNKLPGLEPNRPQRVEQLNVRTQDVRRALDFLCDERGFRAVMGDEMRLDYSKIHIMGHSFGGSTAVNTAVRDQRITGVVVALDPCMYVLDHEITFIKHQTGYNKKTLIILADDYYQSHYPSFQNDYRVSVFRDNATSNSVLSYRFLGSNHASFSEMALMAQGQFRAFNVLRDNDNTRFYLELTICMIRLLLNHPGVKTEEEFLKLAMTQNAKEEESIRGVAVTVKREEEEQRHQAYVKKVV